MTFEEEIQRAVKEQAERRMFRHDHSAYYLRRYGYAGMTGEHDAEWDIWHQPAPTPRYRLTPAQLRRMGITC